MPYVVKAVSMTGPVTWLRRSANGVRSMSIRQDAEIFESAEEAQAALDAMPAVFVRASISFRIEEIDWEGRATG